MQVKELLSRIGALGKAIVKVVQDIQALAIECTIHAVQHGDVTAATQLVDACGPGIRRQSLVAWFERTGPFVWKDSKFGLDSKRAEKMRKVAEEDLRTQLDALKWQEAKKEPKIVSVFDCAEAIDKFFASVHRQIKEGKVEVRNLELLNKIEKETAIWQAKRVLAEAAEEVEAEEVEVIEPATAKTPNAPVPGLIHMLTN